MLEVWKDIEGYEGKYQVSNMGKIKSLGRWRGNNGGTQWMDEKIKSPNWNKGYLYCALYNDGVETRFGIHRLVALHFIPNPNNLPQVNHKDEIPSNNNVDNLEWCDGLYNCNYGTRNERCNVGKRKPIVQLNLLGKIIAEYDYVRETKKYGFDPSSVQRCCSGRYKQYKGFIWKYREDVISG